MASFVVWPTSAAVEVFLITVNDLSGWLDGVCVRSFVFRLTGWSVNCLFCTIGRFCNLAGLVVSCAGRVLGG